IPLNPEQQAKLKTDLATLKSQA
ncbi:MAG: hypothetical protein K0R62_5806, partial [Nonomuraea muscovyensis]|nr:hypothetical protein [Nonomuraea muscovyensis]